MGEGGTDALSWGEGVRVAWDRAGCAQAWPQRRYRRDTASIDRCGGAVNASRVIGWSGLLDPSRPCSVVLGMKPADRDHSDMTATTSRTDWLLFILLGFLWGSSFLFIKIGVEAGLPPFTLVMLRLLIGFGLLAVVVAAARERLPREGRVYGHLFVMGAINIALPFTLITWAEMHVDSTLTSVLNAAVPIFVIPIGAIFLRDEPLTVGRVAGVLLGFVGVALLVGFDPAAAAGVDLFGALAVIAATISYAAGAVYARRNVRGLRPMIPALFQVGFGLLITSVLAFALERPFELTLEPQAFLAVVWLGLLGSGVAYLVFFGLLGRRGAARHGRRCVPAAGVRCHPRGARAARTARWAPARRAGADRRGHRARQQPDRARTVSAEPALLPHHWSRHRCELTSAPKMSPTCWSSH